MRTVTLPAELACHLGTSDISELDEKQLEEKLIGLRESDELDVKLCNYPKDKNRELAKDISAFANTRGGLLVVGADEKNETITELNPINVAQQEIRILDILKNRVSPLLNVQIVTVSSQRVPDMGYLLIAVPSSPLAPHAVKDDQGLLYLTRNGPGNTEMSEPEVATSYQRRFGLMAGQGERLDEVCHIVKNGLDLSEPRAWLLVAGVPTSLGHVDVTNDERNRAHRWLIEMSRNAALGLELSFLSRGAIPALGRFTVFREHGTSAPEKSEGNRAELFHDGASAVAVRVNQPVPLPGETGLFVQVLDEHLTFAMIAALRLIGMHAQRAESSGDLHVVASMFGTAPIRLGYFSMPGMPFIDPMGYQLSEFEQVTRSVPLSDLLNANSKLLDTSRDIVSGVFSSFGVPGSPQLSSEGGFDRSRISKDRMTKIENWFSE